MGTGIFAVEQKNKVLCFNYLCAHRPLDCPQILRRRRNFLETFTPRLILLETSVFRYNLGAPLIAGVFAFMTSIGYRPIDVFDLQYEGGGNLNQMDVLFELDRSQPPGG